MPSLGRIDTPGASEDSTPTSSTAHVDREKTVKFAECIKTKTVHQVIDCLDNAARFWKTGKGANQSGMFREAVCQCLTKGYSTCDIATNIHEVVYGARALVKDEKLFNRISDRVRYVKKNHWKKPMSNKDSMKQTSQAVEELLATMNSLDLDREQRDAASDDEEPILVNVLAAGLKQFHLKKDSAPVPNEINLKKECRDESPLTEQSTEEKALEMEQMILDISHRDSGKAIELTPYLPESTAMAVMPKDADAKRRRVKMFIERPEQAKRYILMGLRKDPEMSSLDMIQMIDYYCK